MAPAYRLSPWTIASAPVLTIAARRRNAAPTGAAAGVDGVDDLGAVDALQVDRGDAEVAVAELALDDDQRDAFARHLDGVGVAELVRREAPADAGARRGVAQLFARGGAATTRGRGSVR